jgi:hypothetical protein
MSIIVGWLDMFARRLLLRCLRTTATLKRAFTGAIHELRSPHDMKIPCMNAADTRRRHHGTKSTKPTKTTKSDLLVSLVGLVCLVAYRRQRVQAIFCAGPGVFLLLKLLARGCRSITQVSARALRRLLCQSVFVGVERHKLMLARRPSRDHTNAA